MAIPSLLCSSVSENIDFMLLILKKIQGLLSHQWPMHQHQNEIIINPGALTLNNKIQFKKMTKIILV